MSFTGKVVIVTGASSGIGAATALMFCREGASVALVGRNQEKLRNVSAQCAKARGSHMIIKADVANDEDAKSIVIQTLGEFGKLDVLVNNAGLVKYGSILNGTTLDAYDGLMSVNLRAVVNLTTLAAPHLVKTKGNIVNISSVAGCKVFSPTATAYSISKVGLTHFTKGAALELASAGVRVNVISPGPVVTDILETAGAEITWEEIKHGTALNRVSESDEVAELVLFLASDKARGITGSNFVTDNGFLLK